MPKSISPSCRSLALSAFAIFFLSLLIHSLLVGGVTWDEYLDFEGVNGSFWHGINLLKGNGPDFHTITYDLEYYGNATRWPTYLIWRLLSGFSWESITLLTRLQFFLASGYVGLNHLNAAFFGALGVLIAALIGRLLPGLKTPYLSGLLLLLLPSWLGHGWMNSKDIPFATSYLLYTYGSTLLFSRCISVNRSLVMTHAVRVLGISLMIGSRASSIVFVVASELVYLCILKRAYFRRAFLALILGVLAALAVTPQSWANPVSYIYEVMEFARSHLGTTESPLFTVEYIFLNLFRSIPLVLWLGLVCFVFFSTRIFGSYQSLRLYAPSLMQLLFAPTLLIVGSKSLYNELRHLIFVFPVICIFSAKGFEQLILSSLGRTFKSCILMLSACSLLLLAVEDIAISPYQYLYTSDVFRLMNPGQSSLRSDYWGFSVRELLASCGKDPTCKKQIESSSLSLRKNDWNQDLFDATISLIQKSEISSGKLFAIHKPQLQIGENDSCSELVAVKRALLFPSFKENIVSRVADCSKP